MEPTRNERFERIFREHYAAVRSYALRRAPSDMAPDVVAETFLVAWRRLDDVPADPLPWLYGVARRVLANARRSTDRGLDLERRLATAAAAPAGPGDPGESVGDAEIALGCGSRSRNARREVLAVLRRAQGGSRGRVPESVPAAGVGAGHTERSASVGASRAARVAG